MFWHWKARTLVNVEISGMELHYGSSSTVEFCLACFVVGSMRNCEQVCDDESL